MSTVEQRKSIGEPLWPTMDWCVITGQTYCPLALPSVVATSREDPFHGVDILRYPDDFLMRKVRDSASFSSEFRDVVDLTGSTAPPTSAAAILPFRTMAYVGDGRDRCALDSHIRGSDGIGYIFLKEGVRFIMSNNSNRCAGDTVQQPSNQAEILVKVPRANIRALTISDEQLSQTNISRSIFELSQECELPVIYIGRNYARTAGRPRFGDLMQISPINDLKIIENPAC